MSRSAALMILLVGACAPAHESGARTDSAAGPGNGPPRPADSLVLQAPGGVQVWFTDARVATATGGERCLERALEVRDSTSRRGVPLLYTREAPTLLGKEAMRAVLYNGCVAGAAYRVDFATISPKRITP